MSSINLKEVLFMITAFCLNHTETSKNIKFGSSLEQTRYHINTELGEEYLRKLGEKVQHDPHFKKPSPCPQIAGRDFINRFLVRWGQAVKFTSNVVRSNDTLNNMFGITVKRLPGGKIIDYSPDFAESMIKTGKNFADNEVPLNTFCKNFSKALMQGLKVIRNNK